MAMLTAHITSTEPGSSQKSKPDRPRRTARDYARITAQLIMAGVAAFWLWFIIAVATSEGAKALAPALSIGLPIAAISLLCWLKPRLGGLFAVVGAGFAAWYFPHPAPQFLMALPGAVAGVTLLLTARAKRTA